MFLVLRLEPGSDAKVRGITEVAGVVSEIYSWGDPFTVESTFGKFPPNVFHGALKRIYVVKHPESDPMLGYYDIKPLTAFHA